MSPSTSGSSAACNWTWAPARRPAAHRRAHQELRCRQRPATGGALLPVRPLPAHLLLASGRPAGQPAGPLERKHESPPWGSKYTININTEMNYWPAETCNLGECVEPLFGHDRGPHRDRRAHRPGHVRRPRLGCASQHRSLAGHRRRLTAPRSACGPPAAPGCACISGSITSSPATEKFLANVYTPR